LGLVIKKAGEVFLRAGGKVRKSIKLL